ncbi:anthranilate phosphoribosyltransferase [Polymorphobacter sp. PAMC 29334]|uniref:anthranilate phosphoribosyltransferase n=1 Tax=Polymorphobacter sp. PAMC 29334 TaxID=2862331 RepID=UPI001C746373|nr:anthranilate phosphoribosyltransferase [Polymorphobacter sp. PAMC 29334]QYE34038.1 anthranilate phosphoribosyltransferase [Polymorphobacter sp. PAMC 29334]
MIRLPDARAPLAADEAASAFALLFDGGPDFDDARRFLTDMAARDETSIEIAAAAQAMRDRMITVKAPPGAIDVCGTGGDGSHSLNVSTAVAIVVAAAGVPVAKHGNRAASSQAGAADTLEALGLDLDRASAAAEQTLDRLGIAFLFAQAHHPALAKLAPVRRAIGRRTVLNLTGPAANPARVARQLIGVARPGFLGVFAGAIEILGTDATLLVAGDEPLDELSVDGPSTVLWVGGTSERVTPETAGLPHHPLSALRGGSAAYNAAALTRLLAGEAGAYRDAVLFNASAALRVAGVADDWRTGVEQATAAIDSGAAARLLAAWIAA